MMDMSLTEDEKVRYARHLSLPGFGEEAQKRLRAGSVLVIGAGGLGSPVLLYLAAAGVGRIGIVDGDCVDMSNLQRQVIHTTADVGRPKVLSAAHKIKALNPHVCVEPYEVFLTADNAPGIMEGYDFVIDATDSLDIKFMVDDICHQLHKPYNHGAIGGYEGQTMTVLPGTARYRDLFPDGADGVECGPVTGPLGVVPGMLGTIQAAEAVKYLSGVGELLTDRLLRFDALTMAFYTVRLR